MSVVFNKPLLSGRETRYIEEAVRSGKISGNGCFTKRCQEYMVSRFGFHKCLLTTSCTDALEMAAILAGISPGDEVIVPSFTFVSSALAFVRQGAGIVFADSRADHPGIDEAQIEELITPRTRAIVPVHYAGVACDMDRITAIAGRYGLFVAEDAAQAIDSFYYSPESPGEGEGERIKRPLGGLGHLGCFSFHETKNIQCGEGGMLCINDPQYTRRAEVIWEKGTNRAAFFRGEVDKYGWVDTGSSFLPSEIVAAFLYAQLENLDDIQEKRKRLWAVYDENLRPLAEQGYFRLPFIPEYATNNAHMFYMVCNSPEERTNLISGLKEKGIMAVFHYQSLHRSQFYKGQYQGKPLPYSDLYSDCLVRLPLYFDLETGQVEQITSAVRTIMKSFRPVGYFHAGHRSKQETEQIHKPGRLL